MRQRAATFGIGALIAALSSACASERPVRYAEYRPAGEGGPAAVIQGTLSQIDGCLFLDTPEGDRWLPVFPASSTRMADDSLYINGAEYQLGTSVEFGGGEGPLSVAHRVPKECGSPAKVWIVHI